MMKEYVCVRCGKTFEANHRTAVCSDCHTAVCVVCGKIFELKHPYTQKTCCSKCRAIYVKESGIAKSSSEKAVNTCRKNNLYSSHMYKRKCAYCGKIFETTSNRRIYCYDKHYGKCPVCGKSVEIKDMSVGPTSCSYECRQRLIERTNIEKYGTRCVFQTDEVKEKIRETTFEKYGSYHYSKTDEYKQKFRQTCLDRFGTTSPLKNEDVKQKLIETNQSRYEGNGPTCNEQVIQKMINTSTRNHGGIGMASNEIRRKIEQTNLSKYGDIVPARTDAVKAKAVATCIAKYGSTSWANSCEGLSKKINDPSKASCFIEFKKDPKKFIECHFDHTPSVKEICRLTGCTDTPIYDILIENGLRDIATFRSSTVEIEINQFLKDEGIIFIRNCRSVITPYELDFYLPDFKVGIECNPTVTHNSSFSDPWGQPRKMPSYHKMKTDMCEKQGVFLFHIFGYEWEHKREIILSMLRNILGRSEKKIFARNTYVCNLSNEDCCKFLDANHRQGSLSASTRLGLRIKGTDELVSVMTFNKVRNTIGYTGQHNFVELSRFCSKLNTSVVGGASKLFKYFLCNNKNCNIVSFSDRAHTRGNLYSTLGFEPVKSSYPGYVWVHILDDSYYNRVSCQKKNLRKLFNDDSIDIDNKTEKQIMEEHGYAQVFDSGTIRWEYKAD